jgi:hypothetical protein
MQEKEFKKMAVRLSKFTKLVSKSAKTDHIRSQVMVV